MINQASSRWSLVAPSELVTRFGRTAAMRLMLTFLWLALGSVYCFAQVGGDEREVAVAHQLSAQQMAINEKLGFPDFFTILFVEDDLKTQLVSTRMEKWIYTRAGVAFIFCDGNCVGVREFQTPKQLPKTAIVYNPTAFSSGMTQKDVVAFFGPDAFTRLAFNEMGFRSEGLKNVELWTNGTVTLGFNQQRIVTVQASCRALPKP